MSEIWKTCKPYAADIAASLGMTPQQLIAVKIMGDNGTMAMSELALHLGCDASNVTSIVDKLERRRFVERRSADHDRRVKSLVLTEEGKQMFELIHARFQQPPPVIARLGTHDQEALCSIFRRALDSLTDEASKAS
jgi:DNA-binding MarR family transcriptional regulator